MELGFGVPTSAIVLASDGTDAGGTWDKAGILIKSPLLGHGHICDEIT